MAVAYRSTGRSVSECHRLANDGQESWLFIFVRSFLSNDTKRMLI